MMIWCQILFYASFYALSPLFFVCVFGCRWELSRANVESVLLLYLLFYQYLGNEGRKPLQPKNIIIINHFEGILCSNPAWINIHIHACIVHKYLFLYIHGDGHGFIFFVMLAHSKHRIIQIKPR